MPTETRSQIDIDIYRFFQIVTLGELTAKTYETYIRGFYRYCIDKQIDPDTADAINALEYFATHPNWAANTRAYACASLRAFYGWKYGKTHPMLELKIRKQMPAPQRTLSADELLQVMAAMDQSTHEGIRNLAIIAFMVDTGLRTSEVCNVVLSRMNLKKKSLHVKIKGGDWGEAVWFDLTDNYLSRWLAIRSQFADPACENLFVSVGGKTPGKKLTRFGLRDTLMRICAKAGVDGVTPHVMRRTFATLATENGAPSRMVQVAGRWKDIRMVERYTRALQAEKIRPYSVINRLMGFQMDDEKTKVTINQ